jgi:ethanolamine utilization protein EutN
MHLARVQGSVVASTISPGLEGIRLLIIQPLNRRLEPKGGAVVAADAVNTAGPDDLIYFVASREAAVAMPETFVPVDHAIIGIVDHVHEVKS